MPRVALIAVATVGALGAGAAAAVHGGGKTVRVEAPPARDVRVPGGTFQMGVTEDDVKSLLADCLAAYRIPRNPQLICTLYETEMAHMAARLVYVSPFRIDRDEVSVADYRACVAAGACALDPLVSGDERFLVPEWPLVNVTWAEAQAFCRWRGGALPTEAQWERAARGDGVAAWPWGETLRPNDFNHGKPRSDLDQQLDRTDNNLDLYNGSPDASDGAEYLAPVGSYRWGEGPYGTRDQAGNAAEWVADAYLPQSFPQRIEPLGYDDLGVIDPVRRGSISDPRVVRGGSWRQPTSVARTNTRDPMQMLNVLQPNRRYTYIGFRCARPE